MARSAKHRQTAKKPESSWWRRLIAVVLTAGALAGAVTAIRSLLPGPDLLDNATFTSGEVRSPERLSDFVSREQINLHSQLSPTPRQTTPQVVLALAQATVSPGAADIATPTESSATPTESSATPTESSTSPTTATPTSSGSSSSASGSATVTSSSSPDISAPSTLTIPPIVQISAGERNHLIRDMIRQHALDPYRLQGLAGPDTQPSPSPTTSVQPFSPQSAHPSYVTVQPVPGLTPIVDDQGRPLPPAVSAAKLAARLNAGRSVPFQAKSAKLDPVGALVTVNVEFEGLRGQSLLLFWRLFPADGALPLPKGWWKTTVAYRLTPGTDHDSASLDMWVPLPKARGPYTLDVILALESNGARLASYETADFH